VLVLSQADIYQALAWPEAIQAVAGAFAALSTGRAAVPLRTFFPVPDQEAVLLLMPGAIQPPPASAEAGQLAVKLVGVFPHNPARGLPLIHGLVTLFEADTGRPLAVLDGATVTAIRTGAASGVATAHLASSDARCLALFGTGAQAATQLKAIGAVRAATLQEVRVVGRDFAKAQQFASRMSTETGYPVRAVSTAAAALEGADIVATATTSLTPLFEDSQLAPGAHINGVGSYQPTMCEIPGPTVARARLIVDVREAALHEAGDIIIPINQGLFSPDHIYAELGEIVAGLKPGRSSFGPTEISFFKSVGNAAQDVAMAHYLYHRARQLGLGTEIAF
jgi:ornithine cyclodeaminase/alanine dehydrogenase-like protein (mu-crystallin family)